ncbi:MAG: hypothetical protein ACK4IY_09655, partial [Chitinophagales bacterium]
MRFRILVAALFSLAAFNSHAQLNIELLGHLDYGADDMSNLWGWTNADGDEFVIAGTYDGTSLVDITNPASPVETQFIDG